MSFLSNTDTGSLVNRYVSCWSVIDRSSLLCSFSQDMRLVDITLPISLSSFLFGTLQSPLVVFYV